MSNSAFLFSHHIFAQSQLSLIVSPCVGDDIRDSLPIGDGDGKLPTNEKGR